MFKNILSAIVFLGISVNILFAQCPASPNSNPSFGANQWNIHAYNGRSRDNIGSLTYRGVYTRATLGFNTDNDFVGGNSGTPSSSSGYSGCSVGVDNHTVVAKRQGFPCGVYEVSILHHDDEAILYVNGVNVWSANCCQFTGIKWAGYLDATSTIEARYAEGGGGASLGVGVTQIFPSSSTGTVSASISPICQGDSDGEVTVSGTLYHNENFSTLPAGITLYQDASLTSSRIQLTPAANSRQGFAVVNNTGHNATSFRTTFNITNVGADGYCFSYGNNLSGLVPGGNVALEELGVGNNLSLGLDYYQNTVYLRYGGVNISTWSHTLNANHTVLFTVDEVGRASLSLSGTSVFSNVFLGSAYYTADKSTWQFAFGGRTGGVNGVHSIDNWFIGEYEYSDDGSTWQTSPVIAGQTVGTSAIEKRLIEDICGNSSTLGSAEVGPTSTLQATAVSPTCVGGNDGSIDLSVSGYIYGARVVKIVQLDNEPFNTNEIQAFEVGTNANVALASAGGTPSMSSLYSGSYPTSWLNDGNTNNGVGAHTNTGVGEWQKVAWPQAVTLDRIVIWNRTSCCYERLDNIRIEIYGDNAETKLLYSQVVNANNGGPGPTSFTLSLNEDNFDPASSTYSWSNSASTEDISGLSAGAYSVTVTDPYGCVNDLTGINVSDPTPLSFSSSVTNPSCLSSSDGSVDLSITSARTSAEPPAFGNLALWTKGDAGVVKNKDGEVIQWQDLSGNDNHFTVSRGSGVTLSNSSIGGKDAINLNGTNSMTISNSLSTTPYTIFVVGRKNTNDNTTRRLVSSSSSNWLLGWHEGENSFYAGNWVTNNSSGPETNTPYVYSVVNNNTSNLFYSNGTDITSSPTAGLQAPGLLCLGGYCFGNSQFSNGDVAEVIYYNRALSTNERRAIEKYLGDKYGLTISHMGVDLSYSWSPNGATTEDVSGLAVGAYSVTVTDAAGCAENDSYTLVNGDVIDPVTTCPSNVVTDVDAGTCGAVVNYLSSFTSASLEPIADAYVNSSAATTNYGSSTLLDVDRGFDRTFLKFDLSNIPKGAIITGAELKMTVNNGFAYGGDGNVYHTFVADDTWTEGGINWNNQPGSSTALGSWFQWCNFTSCLNANPKIERSNSNAALATQIQSELDGDGIMSIRLNSPGYYTQYFSKEHGTASQRPKLTINYDLPLSAVSDNCNNDQLTITRTAGLASGSVFPVGTTTVTHRVTDKAGNFKDCSFTVEVNDVSPTASAAGSDDFTCLSGSELLSANSPTVGTGAWSWTGPGAVNYIAGTSTSSNAEVEFSMGGTYVGSWIITNACGVESIDNTTIKVNLPEAVTTTAGASGVCRSTNENQWVHIFDVDHKIIASIQDGNKNMGDVTVSVPSVGNASPSAVCSGGNNAFMGRFYRFSSSSSWSGDITVRLYFTTAELNSLIEASHTTNTAPASDPNGCEDDDDVNTIADIVATKYTTGAGPGTSGGVFLNQIANGTDFGGHYVDFNVDGFSDFYLHGSESGVPLPVELLSFEANAINNEFIQLDWATATEINNEGFDLMRSTDGVNFEKIAWINGNGSSSQIHEYTYKDFEVAKGITYYYQLRQVDYDGQFEYFDILSARLDKGEDFFIGNLIPNPSKDNQVVRIAIRTSQTQVLTIEVFNNLGKKVTARKTIVEDGYNDLEIDISNLTAGSYILSFEGNFGRETRKLVVVK